MKLENSSIMMALFRVGKDPSDNSVDVELLGHTETFR